VGVVLREVGTGRAKVLAGVWKLYHHSAESSGSSFIEMRAAVGAWKCGSCLECCRASKCPALIVGKWSFKYKVDVE
jgi:TPP-dependent indolepyruvate ferredoxin oxidoreductase alpha subunit